ncbi:MAG: Do family serine endopeptidase [Prolixibacteraceae bacterium]|nr:Do family serine endopeptidase [Prolixibacteraceae bacterium]
MKKIQNVLLILIIAVVTSFSAIFIYSNYIEKPKVVTVTEPRAVQYARQAANMDINVPDLTFAAEASVKTVVHIRTEYQQSTSYQGNNPFFEFFFGDRYRFDEPRVQQASGSGVIISSDGFIVTNNHVIENSDVIKVILNDNREFDAKVVGTDPSTDIALLKVEETKLPAITWGNSDDLKLGEWVLAVGNPFNLTSTVTAGIVSAKARGIGIIGGQLPIESFIQTDAAVNPGNSGGALVNTRGQLVGINTAIASRTGSYSGYSFAVPVSIVKKVVDDLKEYGEVQRAILGVRIQTVNAELAKEFDFDDIAGVYVAGVEEDGAAKDAGIKEGDVIISVDGIKVNTSSELQEQIGKHSPGDEVEVLIKRNNKKKLFNVTLRNTRGGTGIVKNNMLVMGAELDEIDDQLKFKLNIRNGLQITSLENGKLKEAGVKKGFIIVKVNKTPVNSVYDFQQVIKHSSGGVLIEGLYPNGEEAYYVFGID